jgi:hypothetical protein
MSILSDFDARDAVFDPGSGWRVVIHNASNGDIELPVVSARRFLFKLFDADEVTVSFDANEPAALFYTELASDLIVYYNGAAIFRGRGGTTQDVASPDVDTVTINAFEYRELLKRRLLLADASVGFLFVDQAQIAWTLISEAQARPGGALGITQGTGFTGGFGSTGVLRERNYDRGRSVAELIDELAQVQNGFEWSIGPDLRFNVFYPKRGSTTSVILDYGGAVTNVNRSMNPRDFANVVRTTGDSGTTPVESAIAGIATDTRGRWETLDATFDIKEQATLAARAVFDLAVDSVIPYTYSVALKDGYWTGPAQFFIGDQVILLVQTGRMNVNIACRVIEFEVSVDPDGAVDIRLTLAPVL